MTLSEKVLCLGLLQSQHRDEFSNPISLPLSPSWLPPLKKAPPQPTQLIQSPVPLVPRVGSGGSSRSCALRLSSETDVVTDVSRQE